jgi:hypothetical protein
MQVCVRRRPRGSSVASSAPIVALIVALAAAAAPADASAAGRHQPPKGSQTVAQRKIDSRLLREVDRARRGAEKQSEPASGVAIDGKGRALVEIRCDVTPAIQKKLHTLNATVVSSLSDYRSILAWVPLTKLEELAGDDKVYAIQPAPEAMTNRGRR